MGSVFEVTFSTLIFLCTLYLITASNDLKDDGLDRGADSGLWFGPRLGKRSLQLSDEDKSDNYLKLLEAANALKYYYKQMRQTPSETQTDASEVVSKKIIFRPKLTERLAKGKGKYDYYDFTPRLGRKLTEKMPVTAPEEDIVIQEPVVFYPRNNHFSPRLGRNYNFSPQLGRELYEFYPETQIRVARSINKTKSD